MFEVAPLVNNGSIEAQTGTGSVFSQSSSGRPRQPLLAEQAPTCIVARVLVHARTDRNCPITWRLGGRLRKPETDSQQASAALRTAPAARCDGSIAAPTGPQVHVSRSPLPHRVRARWNKPTLPGTSAALRWGSSHTDTQYSHSQICTNQPDDFSTFSPHGARQSRF